MDDWGVYIENAVHKIFLTRPTVTSDFLKAKQVAIEAYDQLRCHHYINESVVLVKLLAKPHLKSLILCLDAVAKKSFIPIISEPNDESCEDDPVVKIVTLVKGRQPFGLTLKVHEATGSMTVAQLVSGSVADQNGSIEVGDEVVEINEMIVCSQNLIELLGTLQSPESHTIKLKLIPTTKIQATKIVLASERKEVYVRTLFSYTPLSDLSLTDPGSGLAFEPGDILHVTHSASPDWFQATKVELASHGPPIANGFSVNNHPKTFGRSGLIRKQMRDKSRDSNEKTSSFTQVTEDGFVLDPGSYEEVIRYVPPSGYYRPIVLIGPPSVGKTELINQLIRTDAEHFCEPIRITTRKPLAGEVHGIDYLFVTEEEFDTFVEADSLIDENVYGENARIGLCVDAVLEIMQSGRVAVFEIRHQYMHNIRSGILKPLIVFVKPPCLELLLETRQIIDTFDAETTRQYGNAENKTIAVQSVPSTPQMRVHKRQEVSSGMSTPTHTVESIVGKLQLSTKDDPHCSLTYLVKQPMKRSEIHNMLKIATQLEQTHQHYCDLVLVNDDLPVALEQLSEWAYRIEGNATWIPKQWVETRDASSVLRDYSKDPTLNV